MLIVANWKAYVESVAKAKKLLALAKRLARTPGVKIVVAPSAPHLGFLAPRNRSSVSFAAQDVSSSTGGALTGEIPAFLVSDVGATYAIIGHSERRALGDTEEIVAKKVQHAAAHDLIPIICVGEHERDPEARYLGILRGQIVSALSPLSQKERMNVIIAYEPIWAIGKTGAEAIAPHDLEEMILYLRKVLSELLPGRASSRVKILYGGSVEPENIRALAGGSRVDGFLIGHASIDILMFQALVKALAA